MPELADLNCKSSIIAFSSLATEWSCSILDNFLTLQMLYEESLEQTELSFTFSVDQNIIISPDAEVSETISGCNQKITYENATYRQLMDLVSLIVLIGVDGFALLALLLGLRFTPMASLELIHSAQLTFLCGAFSELSYIRDGLLKLIHAFGYSPFFEEVLTDVPLVAYNLGFSNHQYTALIVIPLTALVLLMFLFFPANIASSVTEEIYLSTSGE